MAKSVSTFDAEIRRIDMPANLRLSGHVHPGWHLMAVQAGAVTETVGTRIWQMTAGSLRLSPPGAVHEMVFGPAGASCLLLALPARWIPRRWPSRRIVESFFIDSPEMLEWLSADDLDDPGFQGAIVREAIVRRVIARLGQVRDAGAPTAEPTWLPLVKQHLEQAYSPLRIADIATEVGISREHLARVFQRVTGRSPSQYRVAFRFLQAARALSGSQVSLRLAATDAGFCHQSHFTNQCSHRLGVRPSSLRLRGSSESPAALKEKLGGTIDQASLARFPHANE